MYKFLPLTEKDTKDIFKSKNPRQAFKRKQLQKADQIISKYEAFKEFVKKSA